MDRYEPLPLPDPANVTQEQLIQYLEEELRRVAATFQAQADGFRDVLGSSPARPREGQLVYADGAGWDPGEGEGLYVFDGTLWTPLAVKRKNVLINGLFDIWSRGTSLTDQKTTTEELFYSPDRWGGNRASDVNGQNISQYTITSTDRTDYGDSLGTYGMKWQRASGNTSTAAMYQFYALESLDSMPLAGKTVCLSVAAKKGSNYSGGDLSLEISYGTGSNQREYNFTGRTAFSETAALTTSAARHTVIATIPVTATQVGVRLSWTPTGTAGVDDSVVVLGVQLEIGSAPTSFEARSQGLEELLCARYLPAFAETAGPYGTGHAYISNTALVDIPFLVKTRVAPTGLVASAGNTFYLWDAAGSLVACNASPTLYSASKKMATVSCTTAAGITAQRPTGLSAASSSHLRFTGVEL